MNTGIALILAGGMASMSVTAFASPGWRHHEEYRDTQRARVVQVVPVTRLLRVAVTRSACADRPVRTRVYQRGNQGAALVGGVVGGIIGHNIGHGRGAATLAGAIVGAAVGQSLAPGQNSVYTAVAYRPRCVVRTHYETRRQLIGYDVTYRFHGRLHITRMAYQPGRFIRIDKDRSFRRDDD